jgi:hypothetical protein
MTDPMFGQLAIVNKVESQIQRLTCLTAQEEQLNLGKWFVDILYNPELKLE